LTALLKDDEHLEPFPAIPGKDNGFDIEGIAIAGELLLLGLRDLCVPGNDLLILAGPTMDLDGPVYVLRWTGGAQPKQAPLVPAAQLERILTLSYGQGVDHPEGMTIFTDQGSGTCAAPTNRQPCSPAPKARPGSPYWPP
jgi:hypothetical protein